MGETGFKDFRLRVGGLVENPVELSLEVERLGEVEHRTMHHCIQGWSGIAKWGGIPMKALIDLVKPKPEARVVAFFSFGPALYGGAYYDTQSLENVLKPQRLLASRMNGQRLPEVYGAPLRLRVENQLGYKMVKWIERIEFVESEKTLGEGAKGKAAKTKTTNTSTCCPTSDAKGRFNCTGLRTDRSHPILAPASPTQSVVTALSERLVRCRFSLKMGLALRWIY